MSGSKKHERRVDDEQLQRLMGEYIKLTDAYMCGSNGCDAETWEDDDIFDDRDESSRKPDKWNTWPSKSRMCKMGDDQCLNRGTLLIDERIPPGFTVYTLPPSERTSLPPPEADLPPPEADLPPFAYKDEMSLVLETACVVLPLLLHYAQKRREAQLEGRRTRDHSPPASRGNAYSGSRSMGGHDLRDNSVNIGNADSRPRSMGGHNLRERPRPREFFRPVP